MGANETSGVVISGLAPDTDYNVQVSAEFENGEEVQSEPVSFRTPPGSEYPILSIINYNFQMLNVIVLRRAHSKKEKMERWFLNATVTMVSDWQMMERIVFQKKDMKHPIKLFRYYLKKKEK